MKTLNNIKLQVFKFNKEQNNLNLRNIAQQIFNKELYTESEEYCLNSFKNKKCLSINNEAKVKIRSKLLKENKKIALFFINDFLNKNSMTSEIIAESILNEIINELSIKVFIKIEEELNQVIINESSKNNDFEDDIPF